MNNEDKWKKARLKQLNLHCVKDMLYHAHSAYESRELDLYNNVSNAGAYCCSLEELEDVIKDLDALGNMLADEGREDA
jgi:hypothetical protein